MALTVATNTGALMAQAAASAVNRDMETSMERLSTGKRINSASDDAAGVAIASRLSSEIRGTNQAIRNALDAQAMIDTAEGAHAEVENLLQRMREVAVQAANDTNNSNDRTALQAEMTQLTAEIDRIAATTTWAGVYMLNGDGNDGVKTTDADAKNTFNFQISSNESGTSDSDRWHQADRCTSLGIGGTATNATLDHQHQLRRTVHHLTQTKRTVTFTYLHKRNNCRSVQSGINGLCSHRRWHVVYF